ncbi:TPA: fimbrial protein [Stenotrophomonas maltophilia]|nr:fimbrial protein [Stenotrophomonas maltophilia]
MNCGVNPPRARMTLSDAGDASNTGSQLTPTADSDAEGVRVQLLRNGSEVQFGQTWDFEPSVGGVHDHQFTARYIRTDEPLVPGLIKGEAVLDVDYW